MIRYFVRRLLWIIPVLFVVTAITFLLMQSVPGGPWAREKALPQGTIDRLNQKYGLDDPIPVQYVHWVANLIQGNLGPSYKYTDRTVNDIVADGIWTTVQLGLMAFFLAVAVGIPLGIFAALGHNRWPDYLSTGISIIGIAMPSFVLAILLVVFFGGDAQMVADRGLEGTRDVDAAGDGPGRLPDRGDRPLHQGVDARSHPQGLHPHRAQQGRGRP